MPFYGLLHQKDKTQAENVVKSAQTRLGPGPLLRPMGHRSAATPPGILSVNGDLRLVQLGLLEPRAITTKRRRCGFSPASSITLPPLPPPSWAPRPTASDSRAYFSVERAPRTCRLSLVKPLPRLLPQPLPTPAPAPRNHGSSSVWGTPGGCTKALGIT